MSKPAVPARAKEGHNGQIVTKADVAHICEASPKDSGVAVVPGEDYAELLRNLNHLMGS